MSKKNTLIAMLGTAMNIVKATPEDKLRDIEVVDSIVDGVTPDDVVPSKVELLTIGPATGAHGGAAEADIKRNSQLQPQEDVTMAYMELQGRMANIEKGYNSLATAFNSLSATLTKAITVSKETEKEEEEQNDDDAKEATEKAHRIARIQVRKATTADELEADMIADCAEKALKAFDAAISKAEDEAENDADEKATEKARIALKSLRDQLKGVKERISAAKAVTATPAAQTETKKSEDEKEETEEEKAMKAMKALRTFASSKGITASEMFASLSNTLSPAPTFSKSIKKSNSDIYSLLDEANESGRISDNELQAGLLLCQKRDMVDNGMITEAQFTQVFQGAPTTIKSFFIEAN